MSYNAVGEYYATQGMGAYYAVQGFGAVASEFNAGAVWSKWLACASAWQATQTVISDCNVVDQIRAGLGELGYGPLGMAASWGPADQSQLKKLATDHGLPAGTGMPTRQLMDLMENLLKAGKTPGGTPTQYQKVGHTYVPVTNGNGNGNGAALAGMSGGMLLLAAVVIGGVGYVAYKSAKKKGARPRPASMAPGTKAMVLR